MQIKNKKNIDSFRKALLVPFFLCLLSVIPGVKDTYEWLELKTLDTLFTFYPEICNTTRNVQKSESPAIIITKDQSFQEKFGRSPNRSDFAKLLKNLKNQGVEIAAIDLIYDEESKEAEDSELITQLEDFPYPVLANNFVSRGQQSFSLVDFKDTNADRPNWPTPLYKPIANKASAKGLINMPSGLDSVIRYAPLAFHPDASEKFLPALGFASWIGSLFSEQKNVITSIDISNASNLEEAIQMINAFAPFEFHTTGHDGLDSIIAELENSFIYRTIIRIRPELKNERFENSLAENKATIRTKTWLNLPEKKLPLIGTYHTPCIRLPYEKLSEPLTGDSIDSISMTRLMETDEDNNSAFLFGKRRLSLVSDTTIKDISVSSSVVSTITAEIYGSIKTVTNTALKDITIWAINTETGYWQKTNSDNEGRYAFSQMPTGNYVITAYRKQSNGCDKAMLSYEVTGQNQEIPLLMFDNNQNVLTIPVELSKTAFDNQFSLNFSKAKQATNTPELFVYGEVIPMLHSDSSGNCGTSLIPAGYSLLSLSEDEDVEETFTLNESKQLLLNGEISNHKVAAVLPDEESWNIHFFRQQKLSETQNTTINNLPCSLDASISVLSPSATKLNASRQELAIRPDLVLSVSMLPEAAKHTEKQVLVALSASNVDNNARIILLSDFGEEFEIKNNTSKMIVNGDYLVLTEANNVRGLHKPNQINKKVAFIGTSMPSDQDFIITPINFLDVNFPRMPGVNVHANLFSALKQQKFFYAPPFHLDRAPKFWPFIQWFMVLPVFWLLSLRFGNAESTQKTVIVLFILLAIIVCATYLFPYRIIIPVFYPGMLILSFSVTRGFVEWINSRRQAKETQNAFGRFISAEVVKQIIDNPDAIKPGGEKKELSIIFTDIAGFTSISEKLEPEALTALMNNYLNEMTNILFKHGGTLDKYIGDAIMGFWNHPTPQKDHATRAVCCAIEMQKKLRELREEWIKQGLPKVEVRAGINCGNCMVGFIGSNTQMNFTCLGDNVNLASRLEGANKQYGTFIMITESIKQQLNPELFSLRFLDFLAVKGKEQPVLVYEVRGLLAEETEIWKEKAGKIYHQGIDKYLAREWNEAIALFRQVQELMGTDAPSEVYIDRCNYFKDAPPAANWDGRYILKTK